MKWLVLSIGVLCLSSTSVAVAADRQIEGTVKSLNADGFSITVTTKDGAAEQDETFDVLKKAKITVNGEAVPLQNVRPGQKVVVTFNPELEVATSLVATGEGRAAAELTVLNELPNSDGNQSAPWLTQDGLTIYWKARKTDEKQPWIWSAHRNSKEELFQDAKRLVPGNDPTVTGDGLELILLDQQTLLVCKRTSLDQAFQRPQKIAEFEKLGFLAAPCLSGDSRTLYADQIDFAAKSLTPVRFERASRTAKWGEKQIVKVAGLENRRIRFMQVTPDKKYLCCSVNVTKNYDEEPVLMILRADPTGGGFSSPKVVVINDKVILGKFPRYVAATQELFFARNRPELKSDELVVIRNFDPESMPKFPLAGSKQANAGDEGADKNKPNLNGEWLTTAEETNGRNASRAEVSQTNRRIVIKGNSLNMTRVVNGMSGTYTGTFEINAATKSFDWKGNGPRGAHVELRGIYSLSGSTLKLCYKYVKDGGTTRPSQFKTDQNAGTPFVFLTLKKD